MRDAALGPCLDGQEKSLLFEFTELQGLWSEACPDTYHEVGVILVNVVYHLLAVSEILSEEVHGIPQVVRAPVLPVLNDAVEGHLQFAVLVHDAFRLLGTLVAFLRLPEAIGPQREHRHVAGEMAHLCYHAVGTAAIHEVIVNTLTCLRGECHSLSIVLKQRGRIVLPIEAPSLDALQHALEVLQVRLLHALLLAATVHLAVLDSSQTVDGLILVKCESLADLKFVCILPDETPAFLPQEHFSLARHKCQALALRVKLHGQLAALPLVFADRTLHILRLSRYHKALRRLSLNNVYNGRSHELDLYFLRLDAHNPKQPGNDYN